MIIVLRLGHRIGRDPRISTHLALVARAFGADKFILSGQRDEGILKTVSSVVKRFGGDFEIVYERDWKRVVKDYKAKGYTICHLTVYGISIQNIVGKVRSFKNILIIAGGKKVPSDIYKLSDFNISITQQPHSEISALSIFLHEYFQGKEFKKQFRDPEIKVIPSQFGKKVTKNY